MSFLIVEDKVLVRDLIKQLLDSDAACIRECSDGSEALSVYKSFRPDWVLMDIDMPIMNGFVATRELIKNFPDARILILSQYDTPEYRSAAKSAGALGYIHKDNLSQLLPFISQKEKDLLKKEKFHQL